MSKNRYFCGMNTTRLIVSVELETVAAIDWLIGYPYGSQHPTNGNRSEFVRLAIEEKLARDSQRKGKV